MKRIRLILLFITDKKSYITGKVRYLIMLVSLLLSFWGYGQSKKERYRDLSIKWVSEYVKPINANPDDLSDLSFLKEVLGDKRIVAIGEQTHFDGATFEHRSRIIEYLIKELGFEVVLFEAGIFDIHYGNQQARKHKQIDSLRNKLFRFWNNADQHEHLFAFLQQQLATGSQLRFGGFDCNLTSQFGRFKGNFSGYLRKQVAQLDASYLTKDVFQAYAAHWAKIEAHMQEGGRGSSMSSKEADAFLVLSQDIQKWLIKKGEPHWAQMVKSVDQGVVLYTGLDVNNHEMLIKANNQRDVLMADNLEYLLTKKYAGKKVILFGATYHFARNIQNIVPNLIQGIIPMSKSITMGELLDSGLQKEIYTIGFTALEGTYGYVAKGEEGQKVTAAHEKSLSSQLAKHGYNAAFVPLEEIHKDSDYWLNGAVIRFISYDEHTSSPDWSKVMDAVIYIKTMYPATH